MTEPGGTLPTVQIQVTNAVGMALKQTSNVVVQIRIRPKFRLKFSIHACLYLIF